MEGKTLGDVPLNLGPKLEVWDSPNSAGVVIDAVRCCNLALERGLSGTHVAASAYFMQSPPHLVRDETPKDRLKQFVAGESGEETVNG